MAAITAVRDEITSVLASLDQTLANVRTEALAALLPYVVRFVIEDAAARDKEGLLIFDDLIVRVRDLLQGNASVAAAVRARYDALLIDEFQDTDPLQVDIALSFACPALGAPADPGRLFLVGDPKQSIYRFRRADMAIYASTRSRIEEEEGKLPALSLNRRSTKAVIGWVNAVFHTLIGSGDDPAIQPPYRDIHPEREHQLKGPGVTLIGGERPGSAREVRRLEAQQVASWCSAAVNEGWQVYDRGLETVRPASFHDIAVLVPARTILLPLERAFAELGIPYRVEGGSLIYGTQEVRDLINCLTAIDDPADEVAVVGALRSPAYACSDTDLARFKASGGRFNYLSSAIDDRQDRVADSLRGLRSFHQKRHDSSLAALVERFVTDRGLVEIGILDLGGRDSFRRARFVVEQARVFEASGPESLRAFVAWLERRVTGSILDYEGAGLDDDEDAVRVLTIHGAKGLEFPIVIMAGNGANPRAESPIYGTDRATGEIAIAVGAKTRKQRFLLGPTVAVETQETEHAKAERDRLLYVAATRARDHLLVSLFHSSRSDKSPASRLQTDGIAEKHARSMPDRPPQARLPSPPFATLHPEPPPTIEEFQAAHAFLLDSDKTVVYTSATALGRATHDEERDDKEERDDMTEPWARGRAGTHVGRAVHAALQSVSWQADDAEIAAIARAQAVAEAVPDRVDDVARLIRMALASDAAARARAGRALREVPFAMQQGNVVLEGYADLIIDTPDGIEIVDWKTDSISPSEVEQRMESYKLQAGLYVLGIEAATKRKVTRVTYVFVSAGRELTLDDPAELATAAAPSLAGSV